MSNYVVDEDGTLYDGNGNRIGKRDFGDGNVRDCWREKGRIDEDDRYIDEYERDRGWVKQGRRPSDDSGGSGDMIYLILLAGVFYLMYLGIKWLIVQGKISSAHASRSWGITSLLFPPVFFIALKNGFSALNETKLNYYYNDYEQTGQANIAKTGLFLGFIGAALCGILVIGVTFSLLMEALKLFYS